MSVFVTSTMYAYYAIRMNIKVMLIVLRYLKNI